MDIPESARREMYRWMGEKTGEFLSLVDARLNKYSSLWQLSDLAFMPTNTVNLRVCPRTGCNYGIKLITLGIL